MAAALSAAQRVVGTAGDFKKKYDDSKTEFASVREVSDRLGSINDRRLLWPELLAAVSQCVPQDTKIKLDADNPKGLDQNVLMKQLEELVPKSERIYIDSFDCEYMPKVEDWFTDVRTYWGESAAADSPSATPPAATPTECAAAQAPDGATAAPAPGAAEAATTPGPSGEGWVIQLTGHHYHNQGHRVADEYVRDTLLKKLLNMDDAKKGTLISLPGPGGKMTQAAVKDLGISYPVLMPFGAYRKAYSSEVPLPGWSPVNGGNEPPTIKVDRYDFAIQFCWKETPLSKRMEPKAKPTEPEKNPALAAGTDNSTAPKPN